MMNFRSAGVGSCAPFLLSGFLLEHEDTRLQNMDALHGDVVKTHLAPTLQRLFLPGRSVLSRAV